ncbi:hypothetical protein BJF93_09680 [Xaviernesmea oryzae]|uniref:GGDEF domain-containing protein n=1 Tax=Xaviernesmea oryzae TaxID=464029 RepID=A0A1Q9AWS0_9HYPH|nr:diguanylate cyclase [Xaviernesmea oryzae]OLP59870.1 hypothetical protein BJF93_09680 [Xaviernesmea oryzae]SEK47966.1 diguanylate cyclase (GGDEF) domain-containing protein [Xaviernesmea oryzae]
MPETSAYPAPRNRALRWLAEIGDSLPDEIQRRLRSAFFTSKRPLILSAFNSILVALVVYGSTGRPIFLFLAACDLALLCVRIGLVRRIMEPSGPIFLTGLLWAFIQSATLCLVVLSGDVALSILVLASGLAVIGGIAGRNFAAPRYAIAQVTVIDLSFKIAFCIRYPEFLPLIAVQSVLFMLVNIGIVRQHRKVAIDAIRGEIDSRQKAFTDPLTGLPNRRALETAFHGMPSPSPSRALLYLDLDGFKQVNDGLGHAAGDMLLQQVAHRLTSVVRTGATVCRLGGDEFLVLVPRMSTEDARRLGIEIIVAVAEPFDFGDRIVARVGVSVGAAVDEAGRATLQELMLQADQALYAAKASGKGIYRLYDQSVRDRRRPVSSDMPRLDDAPDPQTDLDVQRPGKAALAQMPSAGTS